MIRFQRVVFWYRKYSINHKLNIFCEGRKKNIFRYKSAHEEYQYRKGEEQMRCLKIQKTIFLVTVFIFSLFSFVGSAGAVGFKLGDDAQLDCDVTVTYGVAMRTSDQDDEKLADWSTDDGNRNFDQWDLVNNKVTAIADIQLEYKDVGLFVRPKAFYDHVYFTDNANDSPESNNAYQGGLIDSSDQWADKIEDIHGMNAEILDLFGYYTGRLFDQEYSIRVGKQVISWGESLMITGGISSAQSPIDVSAAQAAGTEVKEIYLPTGSAYLRMGITPSLGLAGYYQWEWEKSRMMEGGTFFSRGDMIDEIKAPLVLDYLPLPIQRGIDEKAKDDGQYGVSLKWMTPWLNSTEVGLYFINYHDKFPLLVSGPPTPASPLATYHLEYTEDIKLYGVSFSSCIGDANVSGEFSYREDLGILPAREVELIDYWQAQTSAIWTVPLPVFADQLALVGEFACGKEVHRGEGNEFAWAYAATFAFSWAQVFQKTDLYLNLASTGTPEGSADRTLPLGDERSFAASIGIELVYDFNLTAGLVYEDRFDRHGLADRDTLSLELSYTF